MGKSWMITFELHDSRVLDLSCDYFNQIIVLEMEVVTSNEDENRNYSPEMRRYLFDKSRHLFNLLLEFITPSSSPLKSYFDWIPNFFTQLYKNNKEFNFFFLRDWFAFEFSIIYSIYIHTHYHFSAHGFEYFCNTNNISLDIFHPFFYVKNSN